jgi:hypothetical protein
VLCALEGVAPKVGKSWDIPDLSKYITPDNPYHAECKKVNDTHAGKVHEIILKTMNGESVADKLISANLVTSGAARQQISAQNNER